ncbi:MAG TPA: nuclear transport factor 2 family protein [Caulobacteraceae bacterium]|nr:nuclear transport factor 2 family protein [Caulobacteraceae bacterium]
MAYEGPIEDRLAIRERIEAYSDAVFRRDAEAWIANWAEDCVWSLPGLEVAGRAAIRAAWEGAMQGFALAAFFATPGAIVVESDRATARTYTQEILTLVGGGTRRIVGAYDDALVRENGVWLFSRRAYQILHDET